MRLAARNVRRERDPRPEREGGDGLSRAWHRSRPVSLLAWRRQRHRGEVARSPAAMRDSKAHPLFLPPNGARRLREAPCGGWYDERGRSPRMAELFSKDGAQLMLTTIAIVLVVLWALGLIGGYTAGGLLHLLLVISIVILAMRFFTGRKVV
jgi:hypothetical protein